MRKMQKHVKDQQITEFRLVRQFTLEAVGVSGSSLRQYRQNHFVPEQKFPDHTISTAVFPCTSGAAPQRKLL